MFEINKNKKGYTLIELLLALGIIAILAVIIFFTYSRVTENNNTKTEIENIAKYYGIYEQHASVQMLSVDSNDLTSNSRYEKEKNGFLSVFQMQDVVPNGKLDLSNETILGVNKFQGKIEIRPLGFFMGNIPVGSCDKMVKYWFSIAETPEEDRENTCYTEAGFNKNLTIYFNYSTKRVMIIEEDDSGDSEIF